MENNEEIMPSAEKKNVEEKIPASSKKEPGGSKIGSLLPFLAFLFFAAYYYLDYKLSLNGILAETGDITNSTISESFQKFSMFGGVIVALISLLIYFILAVAKRVVGLKKFRIINPTPWIVAVTALSGMYSGRR